MQITRRDILVASAAVLVVPSAVRAQSRPAIKVMVGFPPGGATDAIARTLVDKLPPLLEQPVIIDNRPGAGGRVAADAVLQAAADGHTYMIAPNATPVFLTLVPGQNIRWNIVKDFAPVAQLAAYPLGMGVATNIGVNNAREFVQWARRNPGRASFGTPGTGGQNHFLGVQLAKTANIDLTVAPYKGSPPMVTDLVGGHVPAAISLMDGLMAHHRSGRIKVIGVFTKERSPLMPDIPTFAEQGIDVTSGEGWTGMWTKAGTPVAEIQRVQGALQKVLAMPDVRETMTQRLWAHPQYRNGAEMEALLKAELAHWDPIIKASGFKVE